MSRKDYEAFAEMFRQMRQRHRLYKFTAEEILDAIQRESANVFARDNSNFDHARFYEACEK